MRGLHRSRITGEHSDRATPLGQKPVEGPRIERQGSLALFQHLTGAAKSLVQKVIEAKELGSQGGQHSLTAPGHPAGLQLR